MTTLAIYGDSFCDWATSYRPGMTELQASAWSQKICDHYTVTNYSISGSSLYWSMRHFEQTWSQADRIVFVVTSVGRWPGHWQDPKTGRIHTLSSATQCQIALDNKDWVEHIDDYAAKRSVAEAIRDWYLWAKVDQFEQTIQALMIKRIQALRPDALIIPINRWGNPPSIQALVCATDYILAGFRSWPETADRARNLDDFVALSQNYPEKRTICHMTPEVNESFLTAVLQSLEEGVWAPQVPTKIDHPMPIDYYYYRS